MNTDTQAATPTPQKLDQREMILGALGAFVRQRAGLEFGNYGDVKMYRQEQRSITRDRHHAEALLAAVSWRTSITAEKLIAASKRAYSGRLTLTLEPGRVGVDYSTGQYFPTEYRRAVCAVLSSALWEYFRENAPLDAGQTEPHSNLQNVGEYIRRTARRELGASIARRWFV